MSGTIIVVDDNGTKQKCNHVWKPLQNIFQSNDILYKDSVQCYQNEIRKLKEISLMWVSILTFRINEYKIGLSMESVCISKAVIELSIWKSAVKHKVFLFLL